VSLLHGGHSWKQQRQFKDKPHDDDECNLATACLISSYRNHWLIVGKKNSDVIHLKSAPSLHGLDPVLTTARVLASQAEAIVDR